MKPGTVNVMTLVVTATMCTNMATPAIGKGHTNPVDRSSNSGALEFSDTKISPRQLGEPFVRDAPVMEPERITGIMRSMSMDQVKSVLGQPLDVRGSHKQQWNYNFKFMLQDSQSYRICQYKVIFDKEFRVKETVWRRIQCETLASRSTTAGQ